MNNKQTLRTFALKLVFELMKKIKSEIFDITLNECHVEIIY